MGLAVLLVLLGVGCFYLAYREQELKCYNKVVTEVANKI